MQKRELYSAYGTTTKTALLPIDGNSQIVHSVNRLKVVSARWRPQDSILRGQAAKTFTRERA